MGIAPLPVLEVNKMGPPSSQGTLASPQHYAQGHLQFWWDREQGSPPGATDHLILPASCSSPSGLLTSEPACFPSELAWVQGQRGGGGRSGMGTVTRQD